MPDHNDPSAETSTRPAAGGSDGAAAPPGPDAAAVALPVVAERPVLAVALLTAHPGNIRKDLEVTAEFVASIAANGVLVPLRITPEDEGYRVIDGHRRLAGAIRAGLSEVPVDVAAERAGDDAGQYLDMWNSHRHRAGLRPIEEADALFAASQAGATRARIRKATGLKAAGVTGALAAAKLSEGTRAQVEEAGQQLSLDQLAVLAEFDDDPQAVARLTASAQLGRFDHDAEWLRRRRAEQAEHDRLRGELAGAGYAVTESLPAGACYLTSLLHDGQDLTAEAHAGCPGRGVFFRSFDLTEPVHYCADPAAHGHLYRYAGPAGSSGAEPADAAGAGRGGVADPGADPAWA